MIECHQLAVQNTEQIFNLPPITRNDVERILCVVEFFVSDRCPYPLRGPVDDLLDEDPTLCEEPLLPRRAKPRAIANPLCAVPTDPIPSNIVSGEKGLERLVLLRAC